MEIIEHLQPVTGKSVKENEEILCIEVLSEGRAGLIPVEKVENVAASPAVAFIPETREEIIGISIYGKSVVPYYELSDGACRNKGERDIRCGIILRVPGGYVGIAADEVSAEKKVPACEYEEQIPEHLRWVLGGKKCDKTGRQGI